MLSRSITFHVLRIAGPAKKALGDSQVAGYKVGQIAGG